MRDILEPGIFGRAREKYTPDGYVDLGRMTLAVFACLGVAALIAAGLSFLFFSGFYFIVMIPLLAALVCGATVAKAVTVTHCRNPLAAGFLGATVALAAYLGSYHACLMWEIGVQNIHRVDALPTYLSLRWETDTVHDAHEIPNANNNEPVKASPLRYWGNFALFLFEALVTVGAGFAIPWTTAKRPYCSKHRCWLVITKGSVDHDVTSPMDKPSVQEQLGKRGADEFSIHYCTKATAHDDTCDIYLTGTKVMSTGKGTKRENVIDNVKLMPDEIAEFATLLPVDRIASVERAAAESWQEQSPREDDFAGGSSFDSNDSPPGFGLATVTKVESPHGGRFTTRFHRNIRNAIAYSPILGLVGGLGAMCGPMALNNIGWDVPDSGWLTLFGFLLLPTTAFLCVRISTVPYNGMRKLAEFYFPLRSTAIVNCSKASSRFAIIMPRNEVTSSSFGKWDFGFVDVDTSRNEIRFEGDIERYRIPAESIIDITVEQEVFTESHKDTSYEYLVRLVFQTAHGPMERLFSQRHLWRAMSKDDARRQPALELMEHLRTILPPPSNGEELELEFAGSIGE